MRNRMLAAVCFITVAAFAGSVAAQTSATVVGKGPGVAGAMETTKITATITAIDKATRGVTLKGPQGREVTLTAGPEVKNFDQMKVGDQVNVEYVEALTLELKKGGKLVVGRSEVTEAAGAKAGSRPAGMVGKTTTVIADVTKVDPATQMVTLKGPQRTVDLKVRDPEQFKLIKVGDQVEATFTEAMAVTVDPGPAKK